MSVDFDAVDRLPEDEAKRILKDVLRAACTPAFAVLPQRELDLLLFRAMREAGVVSGDATLYSLMTDLRISRAKARNLLFDLEIRQADARSLDARAREALANPRGFVETQGYLAFGIENPVVQAHIKDKVNALGHLTDASFDSTIVRIKPKAMALLVEALMDEAERNAFHEAMVAAGFEPDKSLSTAIAAGLTHLSERVAGETATAIAEGYLDDLAALVTPHARALKDRLVALFRAAREAPAAAPARKPRVRRA